MSKIDGKKNYMIILNKDQVQYIETNFIQLGKLIRQVIDNLMKKKKGAEE